MIHGWLLVAMTFLFMFSGNSAGCHTTQNIGVHTSVQLTTSCFRHWDKKTDEVAFFIHYPR